MELKKRTQEMRTLLSSFWTLEIQLNVDDFFLH